jgi:hypothetical protein
MKRLLVLLFCLFFFYSNIAFGAVDNRTIIASTALDDDPTSVTGTWNIKDYEKVAFFVDYDETEVGGGLSVAVTVEYSYNNSDWVTGYFYDFAGGRTLQTSETLSSDGWYYFWLDVDWQMEYVRVTLTATGSDVDDIATVACHLVGMK